MLSKQTLPTPSGNVVPYFQGSHFSGRDDPSPSVLIMYLPAMKFNLVSEVELGYRK